ncbi:hypothetical protein [Paenibacillus hexagrammi]|uniref:Uncharacterized protein n=1 Tax=Paenibacillus hexagrammi TaxID=2908839 RepID=A0ABY3SRK9_9BACL|nr:hypothetical protein [Paenibacillus sp. YPD9-1]UJF36566.1 hypothetical protein L0M14_30730 [Paenibacillus sp. YPD9-1]
MLAIGIDREGDTYRISGFSLTEGLVDVSVEGKEEADKVLRPMLVTYRHTGQQVIVEDATGEFTQLLNEIEAKPPNVIKVKFEEDES